MSGIAYTAEAVLYNCTGGEIGDPKTWYSTKLTNVRVELTQGKNITASGLKDAAVCTIKVHDEDLPKPYLPPAVWAQEAAKEGALTFDAHSFFIVTKKEDIGAAVNAPEGVILDSDYEDGLQEYLAANFGLTYHVTTADHYSLIPHWHIGGR